MLKALENIAFTNRIVDQTKEKDFMKNVGQIFYSS